VTDLTRLPDVVALARTDLQILSYEWGVTYAGMLLAAQVTGDARYQAYTSERLTALATLAAHTRKRLPAGTTAANYPKPRTEFPFGQCCCHARSTMPARCARRSSRPILRGWAANNCAPGSTTM
jgi:hypothetical protein